MFPNDRPSYAKSHNCVEGFLQEFTEGRVGKLQNIIKNPPSKSGIDDGAIRRLCEAAIAVLENRSDQP